jgi:hypothetical protein
MGRAAIRVVVAIAAALALAPGAGSAEEREGTSFGASGFYLGAGGVFTQNSLLEQQFEDAFPVDVSVDDSWGARGLIGYRLLPFLATELAYEYVDGYDVSVLGIEATTLRSHLVTANLKTILPLWRVQPYALVGVGVVRWEFDDPLGVGLPSGSTGIPVPGVSSLDFLPYVSVGATLQYRFWSPSGR